MRTAVQLYLRTLWNLASPVLDIAAGDDARAFLSPLGLHLPTLAPAGAGAQWFQAAAAHAGAHLVYSHHRFDPAGLGQVTQALIGVLEDARVEWLACRELPGLRRLWLAFHTVDMAAPPSFENLLQRLGRTLLDPVAVDPHPWVRKGRELFFLDGDGAILAFPQPQALPRVASLLGHDIGQMRVQFNARLYRPAPSYRDDNTCLWQTDARRADVVHDVSGGMSNVQPAAMAPVPPMAQLHRYPEWDRLVPVYRPHWCAVLDAPAPSAEPAPDHEPDRDHGRGFGMEPVQVARQAEGERFDLDALVQACVARRIGKGVDPRVHVRRELARGRVSMLLLIDASASTEAPFGGTNQSMLAVSCAAALRCARAIRHAGGTSAIHSFCSDGRHAVHYDRLIDFDQPVDLRGVARVMALRSRLSTRLGAALRHASTLVVSRPGVPRILLFTDGRPHDIDVHDPRYLVEDARQAVRDAARREVLIQCLTLQRASQTSLERVFGRGQVQALAGLGRLSAALAALEGRIKH